MTLRSATIRLAHSNPSLRPHLLPILRSVEAKSSQGDRAEAKDYKRIEDMVAKARDREHLLQLAQNMAKAITDGAKANRRGLAAEDDNYHQVAKVFFDRAVALGCR